MCNPIAMMAVTAIGKASEISATNQAMEAAQTAAVDSQSQMNMQRVAEMEDTNRKASLELTESKREALRTQASTRVAAAESGVAGATPLRNLANVYMQESIRAGTVISKNEAENVMTGIRSQSDFISTRNSINEAESKKSTGLSAALQIGVAGAQGYAAGGGFAEGSTFSGNLKNAFNWGASKPPVDLTLLP
jgi:hypothetical protein